MWTDVEALGIATPEECVERFVWKAFMSEGQYAFSEAQLLDASGADDAEEVRRALDVLVDRGVLTPIESSRFELARKWR